MPFQTSAVRACALGCALALAATGTAAAQEPQTVTAIGTAEVRPTPTDRDGLRGSDDAATRGSF